jgi:hypothetical protein
MDMSKSLTPSDWPAIERQRFLQGMEKAITEMALRPGPRLMLGDRIREELHEVTREVQGIAPAPDLKPGHTRVELNQNNSGGYWWLSDEQVDALLADGWFIDGSNTYRMREGKRALNLSIDLPVTTGAVEIAMIEFQRVTGEDPNAIGCTCCGPPFHFMEA